MRAPPSCAVVALALVSLGGSADAYVAPPPVYIPPDVQHPGDYRHTVDVRPDGAVWVSGRNDFGQLGDGTNVHRATPWKVKSAVKFVPGLPVRLIGLGPRVPESMNLLEGQTGDLEEYDYDAERWIARMHDGSGSVRLISGTPEQLEVKYPLDADVPGVEASKPLGSRRRSGCRVTSQEVKEAWVVHDDASLNLIAYPTNQQCITTALKLPDETMKMYLPRYGFGNEGYALNEEMSEAACARVPPCRACNTYDEDEVCPNDELLCNPPMGAWQHDKCKLKFTPGLTITARQIPLTPQVELNRRTGHFLQYETRYGIEWEAKLTSLTCLSGICDSGNVKSVSLPPHQYELDGEAYDAAAGAFHSVFLWKDSAVWSTGKNSEGQLGDGTTQDRNFPKFVLWGCKDVAAGYYHSVFLLKNGTAMAAGRNKEGQLGDGTSGVRTRPVPVLTEVKQVAAGAYHTIYLREDNTVWATGSNVYGQLGDGGTGSRTAPIQVFSGVQSVRAGEFYSLFVVYNPVTELSTLWSAGLFESGLDRSRAAWEPLQYYNETEVQKMQAVF